MANEDFLPLYTTEGCAPVVTLWASETEARDHWLTDIVGICSECGARVGECYFLCSNSPDYYSPEREFADDLRMEMMSDSEFQAAAAFERFFDPEAADFYDDDAYAEIQEARHSA